MCSNGKDRRLFATSSASSTLVPRSVAEHRNWLHLPEAASWANHSYWMYTVLLKDVVGLERDQVIADLHRRKIETRPVFYPVHHMPPYASNELFPVSEKWSYRGISLPTHGNLTQADVHVVCQHLIETLAMEEVAVETDRVRRAA
ncbi:MAG: DegT/DnrJ/EryC1/StrS family aminotransferase [Pirellulaceae bacterium]